ncbi:hypothetical protein JTB14_014385 [Gonioctena quinquepunctata]|nr:hypothetical protein JTB14_014385 [Gonioctena quinquepunctata]
MSRTLIIVICLLVAFQFAEVVESGQFEIRDGDCTNARVEDMVFRDRVQYNAIPFIEGTKTSNWYGDPVIYCVMAMSLIPQSEGSTVTIKEGGVGHSFVTLEMHTKRGHGFDYNINVFAK